MSTRSLSTVLKCLETLETVARRPQATRISELGREIGESRATTYQRLQTLTDAGWLDRLDDGAYRLSMRACWLANAALAQAGFGERAQTILRDLTAATGESSSLVVLENTRIVIAQHVPSPSFLRVNPEIGMSLSFRDSAAGRIWLAFGPEDLLPRLKAEGAPLPTAADLKQAKKDGVAVGGGGETMPGVKVAAVPIFGRDGACIASVSTSCPEARFEPDRLTEHLREAADRIAALQAPAA